MQSSKELSEAKYNMQECQRSNGFIKVFNEVEYSTCEPCSELLECLIRKKYVDIIYLSMNTDQDGGFEF